ncbi:Rv1733c family protein [Streptomyces lydicus]|uniref:Rv1733c family protein n=1 Tax=Streptomyces lydicus TaxID=47763 RepID=UPI0036EDA74A
MGAVRGVWRWRRNPLRRRTDLIESWVALATVLLIVLGAPVAGWFSGRAAHGALLRTVALQHRERHLVWVTVDRLVSRTPLDPDPETSSQRDAHRRVLARWTAVNGTAHLGQIAAPRPVEPGERFRIWTDDQGRVMPRPMDVSTAGTHAVLAGLGTTAAVGGLIEGGRRLFVGQLMARRYRRWDLEWERAGQDWGRADAGS